MIFKWQQKDGVTEKKKNPFFLAMIRKSLSLIFSMEHLWIFSMEQRYYNKSEMRCSLE